MLDPRSLDINNLPDVLTVKETAALLRLTTQTVSNWSRQGILPHFVVNKRGDRRFKKADILSLIDAQKA